MQRHGTLRRAAALCVFVLMSATQLAPWACPMAAESGLRATVDAAADRGDAPMAGHHHGAHHASAPADDGSAPPSHSGQHHRECMSMRTCVAAVTALATPALELFVGDPSAAPESPRSSYTGPLLAPRTPPPRSA